VPASGPFEVIPAIDIRGRAVVRLRRGRFDRQTTYDWDATCAARAFAADGARWIHVVDLDGARSGEPTLGPQLPRIVEAARPAAVQLGGGLRTVGAVEAALAGGVMRAVVGTRAIAEPAFAADLVRRFGPDRIIAALDIRDGRAVGEAWSSGAPARDAGEALGALSVAGIHHFAVTAIERDGLLRGPDLRLLGSLVELGIGEIVASGGIASLEDLDAVREAGCAAAIVGRAVHEGRLDLRAAIGRFA
jgi:phosphoribosylformimino-5-aminoimidazole carboxamide ribotide isomerase